MKPTAPLLFLFVLGGVAVLLFGVGHCLHEVTGDSPETLGLAWLDEHREAAERYATRALDPGSGEVPDAPLCEHVEVFDDAVAFRLRSGFKRADTGVCFAPNGTPPNVGIGDQPPFTWVHLLGDWYAWEAGYL